MGKTFSPLALAFLNANPQAVKDAIGAQMDAEGYVTLKGSKGQTIYAPESGVLDFSPQPDAQGSQPVEVQIHASEGEGEGRDWHLGPVSLHFDFPKKKGATVSAGEPIGTLTDDLKLALWAEQGPNAETPVQPFGVLGGVHDDLAFVDAPGTITAPASSGEILPASSGGEAGKPPAGCYTGTQVALATAGGVLGWELLKRWLLK